MVDKSDSSSSGGEQYSASSDESVESDEKYKLQLIKEVRKRPNLWKRNNHPKRKRDRDLKDAEWEEVACKLFGDDEQWKTLGEDEKMNEVNKARKKWKNLKDCFDRYVAKKEKGISGTTYRYFKQLKFLKQNNNSSRHNTSGASNQMRPRKSEPSGSRQKSESPKPSEPASKRISAAATSTTRDHPPSDNLATHQRPPTNESRAVLSMSTADFLSNPSGNHPASSSLAVPSTSCVGREVVPVPPETALRDDGPRLPVMPRDDVNRHGMASFEAYLLELLRSRRENEYDEDRDFALSLVPMLRDLDYDKKYFAKSQILHAMKVARYLVPDPMDLPVPINNENPVSQGGGPVRDEHCYDEPSSILGRQSSGEMDYSRGSSLTSDSQSSDDEQNSIEEQNTEPELRK